MEKIKHRYNVALRTLTTLKEVLNKLEYGVPEEYLFEVRDSAAQRFKYSIDTFWKFLKIYLQEQRKVTLESITLRAIIRESVNANVLSVDDAQVLMKCITSRNETSHTYNEELAKKIIEELPRYHDVMYKIMKNISVLEE